MSAHPVVLILGSGPNVRQAEHWPRGWFDLIVVMNNAWRVRPDWDTLVFPEDFPVENRPPDLQPLQRFIEADQFVPSQNTHGGFIMGGATMAYTTAYWALEALQPRVMAFMGCDMVYPKTGDTHFYGTGAPDPLRRDVSLRNLGAKSARLGAIAATQGCACVNLSADPSALVFPRAAAAELGSGIALSGIDASAVFALRAEEDALDYATPTGRYDPDPEAWDTRALDGIDARWISLFGA